jgi:hypothetical protein
VMESDPSVASALSMMPPVATSISFPPIVNRFSPGQIVSAGMLPWKVIELNRVWAGKLLVLLSPFTVRTSTLLTLVVSMASCEASKTRLSPACGATPLAQFLGSLQLVECCQSAPVQTSALGTRRVSRCSTFGRKVLAAVTDFRVGFREIPALWNSENMIAPFRWDIVGNLPLVLHLENGADTFRRFRRVIDAS